MANLKILRNRIRSTQSTKRITSAMKMVAAAKLRRAQEEAEKARPYFERMLAMLGRVQNSTSLPSSLAAFHAHEDAPRILMIMITSDRGLCGPLNSNIFKAVNAATKEWTARGKQVSYVTVGRKGGDYIRRNHPDDLLSIHNNLNTPTPRYEGAQILADVIVNALESGEYARCFLYYNRFVSAIQQQVEEVSLLPLGSKEENHDTDAPLSPTEYEPNVEDVLQVLLPKALETMIYTSLLESFASEQGARMTAMDNANRNAGEMIDKLTITYNRSRQANITNELIEVISGAAAV